MNCKIYVFRHGQTYYNRDGIFTGWKDSKLTSKGIKEAKIIAKKLKNKKFQVAFRTRLTRSKQTLKEVLKYHPECKKIIEDNRMIERSYGNLEGKHHDTIIKKYGKEQYDKWHRGFDVRPPKGESFADVEKRVKKFITYLKKYIKKHKVNIAISAHGNSIRLFRKIIENATKKQAVKWNIPYTKYFEYTIKV
ncbi:2,3-bisphosphoglycerate-dependent phosphoglycerate mutase [Candidatus Woesearchaeota archaeon]|nr:2,3-bisphosphoglycerate-dependent phosphoglycerate mutase [Candidatus Woesearchaeota archaeon]